MAAAPNDGFRVRAAGETQIGGRIHNEDSVLLRPDLSLFVVADGAGGESAGNVASALAVTSIAHHFEETEAEALTAPPFDDLGLSTAARRLATAVQYANREVIQVAKSSDRHFGMGTTVAAAFVEPSRGLIHLAHVGDSRVYRLRQGRLELLTQDHTLINDVLEMRPDIGPESAAQLPRNVITRALGMDRQVRVAVRSHRLVPGDRFLICSDGVSDVLSDHQVREVLTLRQDAGDRARVFLKLAGEANTADNVAAIVIDAELIGGSAGGAVESDIRRKPIRRLEQSMPGSQPAEDDYPEIIVLDARREDDTGVHFVPAASANDQMLDAVRVFTRPSTPPPPPVPCQGCDKPVPSDADACPHCGFERWGS